MQEHEEVQPVIHRERVQPTVKQVTQPIHETQVLPSTQEQKILPPQYKETLQPWVASPHCLFWDYDLLTRTSFTSNRGAGTAVGPRTDIPSTTNVAETQKHTLLKVLTNLIDLFWKVIGTRSLPYLPYEYIRSHRWRRLWPSQRWSRCSRSFKRMWSNIISYRPNNPSTNE